jgi:hypothetical protein
MKRRGQFVSPFPFNPRREIMNVIPMNHRSRQNLVRGMAGVAVALAVLASVTRLFAQVSSVP